MAQRRHILRRIIFGVHATVVSGTQDTYVKAAPTLGEHTEQGLGTLLGKSAEDIAALRARAIL